MFIRLLLAAVWRNRLWEAGRSAITTTLATNDSVTCYFPDPNRHSNGDVGYTVGSKCVNFMGERDELEMKVRTHWLTDDIYSHVTGTQLNIAFWSFPPSFLPRPPYLLHSLKSISDKAYSQTLNQNISPFFMCVQSLIYQSYSL